MTERFKVHKMIEGCTSGEDIDVDFLKELIAEDRLVDDLTMHIEDTKENKILTYRECVNLLNENERLKEENEVLKSTEMEYEDALGRLEEENEQLKQFQQKVFNLINRKIKKHEEACSSAVRAGMPSSILYDEIELLEELKKELEE